MLLIKECEKNFFHNFFIFYILHNFFRDCIQKIRIFRIFLFSNIYFTKKLIPERIFVSKEIPLSQSHLDALETLCSSDKILWQKITHLMKFMFIFEFSLTLDTHLGGQINFLSKMKKRVLINMHYHIF